jgi:hypothetical protein
MASGDPSDHDPTAADRSRRRATVAVVVGLVALGAAVLPLVGLFGLRWAPPWPFLLVGAFGAPGVAVAAGGFAGVTARGEPAHQVVGGAVALAGAALLLAWAGLAFVGWLWLSGRVPD